LLRRVFSGVILILLLMGIFALAFNVQPVKASGTIYIRADGSIDPPTAPILTVDNVTYTFTGNITSDADGIVVEKDNIVVDGARYTLQGTGVYPYKGIDLTSRSNVTIKNTRINAFWCSIYLSGSSGNSVSGNNITNNDYGILFLWSSNCNRISGNNITANKNHGISLFDSSDNNSISGNNLRNNGEGIELWSSSSNSMVGNNITNMWDGITLTNSSNNKLRDNNMSDNQYNFGVYGLELSDLINDVDSSNTVDGKLVCYWVNRHDEVVPADAGYVAVVNSTDITVKNLDLKNNEQGILLAYSKNSTITGNNITNNWLGVESIESSNNSVVGNNITNSYYGILLGYSSNNTISGNNITANNYYGISLYSSSNNTIYHNNLIDNTQQVYDISLDHPELPNSINVWDDGYPSGGNYWSDYKGSDEKSGPNQDLPGSDCIGDTPYVIDANNRDRYPLMKPWTPPVEVQVGVKTGDWIKLDYTITGWPPGTPYPEWIKIEFLSVQATIATIRVTLRMSNGTEQSDTITADVTAGGGTFGTLSGFVIPANLTTGDSIYMSGCGYVTIAGETARTYAGANRTVVYTSFTLYGAQLTYYWDKKTGIMVEAYGIYPQLNMTATVKATETNMWQRLYGDVNSDGVVDIRDIAIFGKAFGSYPGHPRWNQTADLDGNGIINILDGVMIAKNFGKKW
jgi:parallel beta-helix repeat protein